MSESARMKDSGLDQMTQFGIENPSSPSKEDLKKLFKARHETEKLSERQLLDYLQDVAVPTQTLIETWKEYGQQDGATERKHLENISRAIKVQELRMMLAKTEKEREELTKEVRNLVAMSNQSVTWGRIFKFASGLAATVVVGAAIVVVGSFVRNNNAS